MLQDVLLVAVYKSIITWLFMYHPCISALDPSYITPSFALLTQADIIGYLADMRTNNKKSNVTITYTYQVFRLYDLTSDISGYLPQQQLIFGNY